MEKQQKQNKSEFTTEDFQNAINQLSEEVLQDLIEEELVRQIFKSCFKVNKGE